MFSFYIELELLKVKYPSYFSAQWVLRYKGKDVIVFRLKRKRKDNNSRQTLEAAIENI